MIGRFDLVKLRTAKHVSYLSGPAGRPASPDGNWIVVARVADTNFLVCCKEGTTIQVPGDDVVKVADYNLQVGLDALKGIKFKSDLGKIRRFRHGQKEDK